jgi:thiol:disulfide interchange protein
MPPNKFSKSRIGKAGFLRSILILIGVVLIVAVVFLIKNNSEPVPEVSESFETPEMQLDWYLENQRPVFLFFHSNTCQTCTDMMDVVDQVYPEFTDQVGLVDVDVYDPKNNHLLHRAQIRNIPTQIFINGNGEGKMKIGGMHPEELRAVLQSLSEGGDFGN